jgi:hypothetical protein
MAGGGMKVLQDFTRDPGLGLADAVGVSTSVRPGRGRNRVKTEVDEKVKKPADGVRKKSPPARKTPSRGRYVDEYARPAV